MNLNEAITRLEQAKNWYEHHHAQEQVDAHQLGIEAMKLLQREREYHVSFAGELLPGETEES